MNEMNKKTAPWGGDRKDTGGPGPGPGPDKPKIKKIPPMSEAEMSLQFERMQGADACENIMGRLSYYYTAARMTELVTLFSKAKSVKIEMPWGIYRGSDAASRCFLMDHVDRNTKDKARYETLKGRMVIHDMCSPMVEVAGDAKTARGCWISPGLEAYAKDGKGNGYWSWYRFAADFILEQGDWKLWHLVMYPYFASEYRKNWAESPKFVFAPETNHADEAAPEQYYYDVKTAYPDDEPELPVPYATFADVTPVY